MGVATLRIAAPVYAQNANQYVSGSFELVDCFGPISINESGQIVFGRAGTALLTGQACVANVVQNDICHVRVGAEGSRWHSQGRVTEDFDTFAVCPGAMAVKQGEVFYPWYKCEQGGGSYLTKDNTSFTFVLFGGST